MNDAAATSSARVGAATALLDRGWGRPAQTIEATITPGVNALDSALDGMASELLAKMRTDTPSPKTSESKLLMAEGNA